MQPWAQEVHLAASGAGCDGLFSLYNSLGDKTLIGTNNVGTLLDGPEKVIRYGALTLGDGTTPTSLTASSRCKGLTILCDSLMVKANATMHMTGRGARVWSGDDLFFPFIDYRIPFKVVLASSRITFPQAMAIITEQGFAPWDQGTWQHSVAALYGFNLSVSLVGSVNLLSASGGGSGGAQSVMGTGVGGNGGASGGMGGGGSGGSNTIGAGSYWAARGGFGCPYSGGSGSGACFANSGYDGYTMEGAPLQSKFSGPGGRGGMLWHSNNSSVDSQLAGFGCGGAGNPGGLGTPGVNSNPGNDGTGGKLTIICRGPITVQSGGRIEANGIPGGSGANNAVGGGGSGGGHVSIISPASPANSGTIQAAGGAGGTGNYGNGGAGGAGSVVTKTFGDMGW